MLHAVDWQIITDVWDDGACSVFRVRSGSELDSDTSAFPYELTRFYILEDLNLQQDRQCTYNVTIWLLRVTSIAVETQQWILCPPLPFTFCHKRQDFRKKCIKSKKVFLFSQQFLSKTILILKIQRVVIVNVHRPSCKVLVMLVTF